jgi:hypothetical protein
LGVFVPTPAGTRAAGIAATVATMSDKDARFRRLAPSGDLFAHFGVAVENATTEPSPAAARAMTACTHCGWYVELGSAACPICGKARVGAGTP